MKEIPLTRGYVAVVDDEDYALVSQFEWHPKIDGESICAVHGSQTQQLMHRLILGVDPTVIVIHKDRNGLNNRRSNLHIVGGPNPVTHLSDGTSVLVLKRKDETFLCYIDTSDYPLVKDYRWRAHVRRTKSRTVYAHAWKKDITIKMHRLLFPEAESVDHRDGNGLNNRRSNLRAATSSQQAQNSPKQLLTSSKFKGVSARQHRGFRAYITVNRKQIHLGIFDSEIEAAIAYNKAAVERFGTFARLNDVEQVGEKAAMNTNRLGHPPRRRKKLAKAA